MNQRRAGLPPAHPSLPVAPRIMNSGRNEPTSASSQAASTAQALTAALANPYGQLNYSQPSYSSHYAQAYSRWPMTNAQGYTLSSTYIPCTSEAQSSNSSRVANNSSGSRPPQSFSSSSWYQPGDHRCRYRGCTFAGAHKAVEIHMMDRHLIYPPGWEHSRQKSDWDADPSLKGKPIPIQGTTIILDTPELLDAWIAERKRRWPSSALVEQKKRKREEAIARGQFSVDDPSLLGRKRPKSNDNSTNVGQSHNRRWDGGNRGRAPMDSGWRGRGRGGATVRQRTSASTVIPEESLTVPHQPESGSSSEGDDGDSPEILSSKPPPARTMPPNIADRDDGHGGRHEASICGLVARHQSIRRFTPQRPPRNPFASRPTLLRNLLLPEIRITISNLSQAIRFLVDNKFLQGVEVRPGEGDESLIEVIGEHPEES